MLLTLNAKHSKVPNTCVLSFLIVAVNMSIATWVYNILISLSGDVYLKGIVMKIEKALINDG